MGVVGLFAVDAVGTVVHDATIERRESYFVDCTGVRVGGGRAVEPSEGCRKGVLTMDEEVAFLDGLVVSAAVKLDDSLAPPIPGSVGPWEVFSSMTGFSFTGLTVVVVVVVVAITFPAEMGLKLRQSCD